MLPAQIMPAFEGGYPSSIATVSGDGIPNITNLSRVWYVDPEHIAIANQMLNKTAVNMASNPLGFIRIANPHDLLHWELAVRYIRSERDGALFEKISQDLHAVSWIAGVQYPVPLRSAMVFQVLSVRQCAEESHHLTQAPETFGELLRVLAQALEWHRSSYWMPAVEGGDQVRLLASRGVPGAGTDRAAFDAMKRLAALAAADNRIVRLRNVRSQLRYVHTIRDQGDKQPDGQSPQVDRLPEHFLALPVIAYDALIGIIACEATGSGAAAFDRWDDDELLLLARKLGETIASMAPVPEAEREPLFRQAVERTKLQWIKAKDPFHTALSARERQVAAHVAAGRTNADIAKALFISTRTVTTHLERIYQKLEVTSRAALTRYMAAGGLLEDEPNGAAESKNT